MAPNSAAVSLSVAASTANSTEATVAVPKAAPIERENCTEAAASPSMRGPDADWTVTWTTPMTVPMQSPFQRNTQASCTVPISGAASASSSRFKVTRINP